MSKLDELRALREASLKRSRGGGGSRPAVEKPAREPAAQVPAMVEGASQVQEEIGKGRRRSTPVDGIAPIPRDYVCPMCEARRKADLARLHKHRAKKEVIGR